MPFSGFPVKIDVKMDKKEIQGLFDPKTFALMMNDDILREATKYMAYGSMLFLSDLLSPGYIVDGVIVGATGTAASNLGVAELASGIAGPSHAVYEGFKTQANAYIRTGTQPRGKGGKFPPINRIKQWMIAKGVGNFGFGQAVAEAERDPLDSVAWAIAGSIKKYGTSRGHKPLYPGGQKRFDYVGYAMVKRKMVEKLWTVLMMSEIPLMNRILVSYLKTGSRARTSWGTKKRIKVL